LGGGVEVRDIIIIAAAVIVIVVAVGFSRMLMDGRRLRAKLHERRVEDAERDELLKGRFDDTTVTLPTLPGDGE
jgi:hypothetical protein